MATMQSDDIAFKNTYYQIMSNNLYEVKTTELQRDRNKNNNKNSGL